MLARLPRPIAALALIVSSGAAPLPLPAQRLPLLDSARLRLITEEVSGDAAYEHVRWMTTTGHRARAGSDALWTAAEYFERQARAAGLEDVTLIRQRSTTPPWNARFADLWIVSPAPERIASTLQTPIHLADYSRAADVTAELVDVGAGAGAADYEGRDVAGKIVLAHGPLTTVMTEAVIRRGAAGIVWYPDPFSSPNGITGAPQREDQIRWTSVQSGQVDGKDPTFAFVLSMRQGVDLRNRLRASREPVTVRAQVDARLASARGDEPWQVMVEAYIRGADPGAAQDVVLTGHLQEGPYAANDDASGCASTLEVARALSRLIAEGRLPRPRRSLRFWWVTEISSQRQYFADNPAAHRAMWVNVNQDMVGANQALDVMRKQNVTRVPATRFHFLNDVMEAVVEYMVAANTFELAQLQAGHAMYPRPHLAHRGSRHRYNAEPIWFHENTDHMTFNEAPIGVPGVSFTNMPDRYIHSTDDDIHHIDATQLGRNAASAALIAYIMASADTGSFRALAAGTVGRGMERMGRNLGLALSWLAASPDAASYHHGEDQVRYAAARERQALRSLAQVAPGLTSTVAPLVAPLVAELDRREAQALRDVQLAWRQASGRRDLPARTLSDAERQLAALRPALAAGPAEFLVRRSRIQGVPGLHALMATEVLAAVDGRRTGLDILRLVSAEAREAGAHYYGTVTAEAVLAYLRNLEKAEVVRSR
jgi:hypothetical protein